MDDILKLYFNETEELIEQILDDIDLLKNEPSADAINEILRKFHTIKGSSYSVGFKKIGDLAHKIEDFFVKIRDGKEELNDEIISNLISVVENLRNFVETISSQESPQDSGLEIDFEIGEYDKDTHKPPVASSEISYSPQTSYTLQTPGQVSDKQPIREQLKEKLSDKSIVDYLSDSEIIQLKRYIDEQRDLYLGFLKLSFDSEYDKEGKNVMQNIKDKGFEIISTITKIEGDFIIFCFIISPTRDDANIEELKKIIDVQKILSSTKKVKSIAQPSKISLKVDISEIEKIMNIIGDLVTIKNSLQIFLEPLFASFGIQHQELIQKIRDNMSEVERKIRDIQDIVLEIRMFSLDDILKLVERDIISTANELGKKVEVRREGESISIDTEIARRLRNSLLHIARNSVTHGIEPPEERRKLGKNEVGKVIIRTRRKGRYIVTEITDDGKGIDPAYVVQKYLAWKQSNPILTRKYDFGETENDFKLPDGSWNKEKVFKLLFLPGFSTRDSADKGAGRGAGLYEVKREIEEFMGGRIYVRSELGEGTTFSIQIPTAKIVVETVIFQWKGKKYALPLSSITKTEIFPENRNIIIKVLQGRKIVEISGREYPLLTLEEIFENRISDLPERFYIFIVESEEGKYSDIGLVADEILDIRDAVMKNLDKNVLNLKGVSSVIEVIGEEGKKEIIPVIDVMRIPELIS
jgi:two-component system, chemotaxis family, sensor kinase CheA